MDSNNCIKDTYPVNGLAWLMDELNTDLKHERAVERKESQVKRAHGCCCV